MAAVTPLKRWLSGFATWAPGDYLPLGFGGTGATTAADARASLGLPTGPMVGYTPSVRSSRGSITTLGTVTGRYQYLSDKIVFVEMSILITSIGTAAGALYAGLPATASAYEFAVAGRERNATGVMLQGYIAPGATEMAITTYNNGNPGGSGYALILSGLYEVA